MFQHENLVRAYGASCPDGVYARKTPKRLRGDGYQKAAGTLLGSALLAWGWGLLHRY